MWSGKNALLLSLLFSSCSLLSFQDFEINCSVKEDTLFFSEENISLTFSEAPEKESCQRLVTLICEGSTASLSFDWADDSTLSFCPKNGWQKGKKYELTVNGFFYVSTGAIYNSTLKRNFTYGRKDEDFSLVSFPEDLLLENKVPLVFEFSSAVSPSSFTENFSLSPSASYDIFFSEDFKRVTLTPKEKWEKNTAYFWSLSEKVQSQSGLCLCKSQSAFLSSVFENDVAKLVECSPCLYNEIDDSYSILSSAPLDSLRNRQGIAFCLSKEISLEKARSSFTLTPTLKGSILPCDTSFTKFVFLSEEDYETGQRYEIKISLYGDHYFYFTPDIDFLTITGISLNNSPLPQDTVPCLSFPDDEKITLSFSFSTNIPFSERVKVEKSISLYLLFPLIAASPVLENVKWNLNGNLVTFTWTGIKKRDFPVYYQINVSGGKTNIKNERGQYLKEDLCCAFCLK